MSNSKEQAEQAVTNAKAVVRRYVKSLRKDGFPVDMAYLYGSYARGNFKQESDIDVCVIVDNFRNDWDSKEKYLWHKAWRIDSKIEPIGYSPEEFEQEWIPLVAEIKKHGVRVV